MVQLVVLSRFEREISGSKPLVFPLHHKTILQDIHCGTCSLSSGVEPPISD